MRQAPLLLPLVSCGFIYILPWETHPETGFFKTPLLFFLPRSRSQDKKVNSKALIFSRPATRKPHPLRQYLRCINRFFILQTCLYQPGAAPGITNNAANCCNFKIKLHWRSLPMRRLQDASLPQPPSLKIRKYLLDAGFWNHDKARQDRAPPGYTTRPREANPPPAGPEHEDLLRTSQEAPQTCSRCKSQCPGPAGERLSPARPGPRPAQRLAARKGYAIKGRTRLPYQPRTSPRSASTPPQDRASPIVAPGQRREQPGHTARSESRTVHDRLRLYPRQAQLHPKPPRIK